MEEKRMYVFKDGREIYIPDGEEFNEPNNNDNLNNSDMKIFKNNKEVNTPNEKAVLQAEIRELIKNNSTSNEIEKRPSIRDNQNQRELNLKILEMGIRSIENDKHNIEQQKKQGSLTPKEEKELKEYFKKYDSILAKYKK